MEIKPLLVMLAYNRLECSQQALDSLRNTVDFNDIDIHIVNHGSSDGTQEWLQQQTDIHTHHIENNIGFSYAMNLFVKQYRQAGQHLIQLDNDTVINTKGWLPMWLDCLQPSIAIIGAYLLGDPEFELRITTLGPIWDMHIITSNFILFNGEFLDQIGYYDILAPNHTQGFTDLIFSEKAKVLNRRLVCLPDVRATVLVNPRIDYPKNIRLAFKERCETISTTGRIYTNERGELM